MSAVPSDPESPSAEAAPRERVGATDAAGRRVPDFFIVGHQKCGTTALYRMLQDHPEIYMPAEKEPRYFIPELRPKPLDGRKPKRPTTLEDYLALFADAGPGQIAGEASPQYLRYPEVPPAIAELSPGAKIIVLLREPADFLRSFHGQMLHNRIETEKDFQKAMELEPARRRGERFPRGCNRQKWLLYSDHVRYRTQLESLYASFPREQVLVLAYEDYRRDNEAVVREVLRFLEVDDTRPIEQIDTHPLRDVRMQKLHHLTTSMQEARRNPKAVHPAVRALDAVVPSGLRERLGDRWRDVIYQKRRQPSAEFMNELRRRFKPEVEAVSELLDRDFVTLWGYDRID
ncbi:MAG TPA: sulfotransferase [Solirubrobacteraceae bacterium]|nr:sulfotransferase [Solirubrobacteraceae bacterium]